MQAALKHNVCMPETETVTTMGVDCGSRRNVNLFPDLQKFVLYLCYYQIMRNGKGKQVHFNPFNLQHTTIQFIIQVVEIYFYTSQDLYIPSESVKSLVESN